MSEQQPCDNRGPRIGEDGTRCRRPSGHVGDHATAPEDGFGDVRWSQWADPMTSVPPTQPPAAPETDVRLTEAERKALLSVEHDLAAIAVVERIVAERVRVVTARAESAEAAHAALVKVLDEYFNFDIDPWDDHDGALPAPEDVWRLHRDLKAAREER